MQPVPTVGQANTQKRWRLPQMLYCRYDVSGVPDKLGSASRELKLSLQNCLCNAGFSGPDGSRCIRCAGGNYKASPGSNACTDCGAGKYSEAVAATSDTTCLSVACPTSSDAPVGSSSLQNCLCDVGFSGPDGGPCFQCIIDWEVRIWCLYSLC
jgi:hypothetical protein